MKKIKLLCLLLFTGLALFGLTNNNRFVHTTRAFSSGPPAGVSGAPGENTCLACHSTSPGAGQFTITAPANYTPGQTYQIVVRHVTADVSRQRWGFQLTSLAGTAMAGTLVNTSGNTQVISGFGGRFYIEQTLAGSFGGQTGGSVWTFDWTAPATDVGPVTFYSAGNQANNDGVPDGDRIFTTTATTQPQPPVAPRPPVFDFDGDDKTDIAIFRPPPGEWWYSRSSDNQVVAAQFGSSTDIITPGDFTGDDRTDIAFFRPTTGEWFFLRSENGSFFAFPFGTTGDIPAPADYDGDGKTDVAVFRPSVATWFILRSSDNVTSINQFGVPEDEPVAADYDGDGKADIGIFRPSVGEWWIARSTAGLISVQFGSSSDKTVSGDYTGDGKADIAFFRPSTGFWFILRSEDNSFFSFPFGAAGDSPVPGDYDGDARFDAAVFRSSSVTWFVQRSTAGTLITTFGSPGDSPVPGAFVR